MPYESRFCHSCGQWAGESAVAEPGTTHKEPGSILWVHSECQQKAKNG